MPHSEKHLQFERERELEKTNIEDCEHNYNDEGVCIECLERDGTPFENDTEDEWFDEPEV